MSNLIRTSLLWIALLGVGCDATDFKRPPDGGASFYNGAGSEWTAQLNPDRTFMLLHFPMLGQMTADQLINGSYASQANGLDSLTVSSSAGSSPPQEGAGGAAAEIPGALLVLSPFSGGNLVPMVPAGSCPSSATSANLIKIKTSVGWTPDTSDASAAFTYDPNSNAALLPRRYTLQNSSASIDSVSLGGGSCGDGIVTPDSGAELFVTDGGAVIVHTQPTAEDQGLDEIYLGLPPADHALLPSSIAGSYAGFLFVNDAASVNAAVQLTLAGGDAGVSGAVTASDASNAGAQVVLGAAGPDSGVVVGTIDTSGASGGGAAQPLTCAAQLGVGGSSQNLLVCAGASQSGHLVSLILVGNG